MFLKELITEFNCLSPKYIILENYVNPLSLRYIILENNDNLVN